MQWLRVALSPSVIARAVKVALVVGCVLNLVNQGAVLHAGEFADFDAMRGLLNFMVPYCVATYGATGALLARPAHQFEPQPQPQPLRKAA